MTRYYCRCFAVFKQ